jgi:hypothetical protein
MLGRHHVRTLHGTLLVVLALAALAFSAAPSISRPAPVAPAPRLHAALLPGGTAERGALQAQAVYLFVRVKHDNPPRQGLLVSPETVPLSDQPGTRQKGAVIPIDKGWQNFDAALNSPPAFRWLLTPHAALVNINYGPAEDPQAESITFAGNVLLIDQIVDHYGHISSFGYSELPPAAKTINYQNYPQFIQKVTAINSRTGAILNPGKALDVYFALLHKTGLWIDMNQVEVFPSLPMKISPQAWVTRGLRVHGQCLVPSPEIDGLYPSQSATVISYVPRGSDVLAQVQLPDGKSGCIALLYRSTEFTGWHMDTLPPIRPAR